MNLPALPIDAVLPDLAAALREHPCVVLRAPTGAGKTTRVPPALLDAGLAANGTLVMLEPRRLAARAAARRMAAERGGTVGDEIGYQVRFDKRVGPRTRIQVVTDGILVRMLQDDPFLEAVSVIVFDEFHERSLQLDLGLAMVRRVQQTVRPDLKIVVMSATLASAVIAEYLGNCPVVESEGRLYPVEISYLSQPQPMSLPERAAAGVEQILTRTSGDVLVFLPGVGEIRRTASLLQAVAAEQRLAVMELYGDLPPEQQDAVLNRSDRRKLVLATNVAETSVTIEGITAVVDTGQARVLRFDPGLGLDRLVLSRISRASADQRAGRAGRTQPGVCLRLWTDREQRGLAEQEEPEIRRVDLAGPALELLCWGETDVGRFPWFEPPSEAAVAQALALLERLGAVAGRQVTDLGRRLVRLPVHPRIARLLVAGHRAGHPARAALVGALLSERDPFSRPASGRDSRRAVSHRSPSDVLDRVAALEEFARSGRRETPVGLLHPGAARFVLQARDQLQRLLSQACGPASRPEVSADEAVLRALLAAFPDRVARRREPGSRKAVLVGGRGVWIGDESAVTEAELFVCVDLDAGKTEAIARQVSAIEREWLSPERLRVSIDVGFDPERERITAVRRTRWEDLVLDEAATSPPTDCDVSQVLAEAAGSHLDRVLPTDDPDVGRFLARVRCLREWLPELELPAFEESELRELLPGLCANCRSFADLRRAPWLHFLKSRLTSAQLQAVDREAPERLRVPSGSQITLQYEVGRPPILAARIQELFGWAETPRIARGRVRVLLHLLAPNQRPQQVTDDLRSFWDNTYQQVRKDLRRRYPKHAWPEDPWNASPERRPSRKPPS